MSSTEFALSSLLSQCLYLIFNDYLNFIFAFTVSKYVAYAIA